MQLNPQEVQRIIDTALAEDIGRGDITAQLLIPDIATARMQFVNREPLVVCGVEIIRQVFHTLNTSVQCEAKVRDGAHVTSRQTLMEVAGPARTLLTGERTALNLLQRMSSVATLTAKYVERVQGTKAKILDTRKTMPGLRILDKYAVTMGGGRNHRMRLDDGILIKDNHIALCGGVAAAVKKARAGAKGLPVEVECDTLAQLEEAVKAGADIIMLDNMTPQQMEEAVKLVAGRAKLEASGGVSLETVRSIAETGMDYISVGRLTHSAPSVDIGLDINMTMTA